jgi:hypothetical protein
MIRTIVSSGNDALNLLFEAAAHTQDDGVQSKRKAPAYGTSHKHYQTMPEAVAIGTSPAAALPVKISDSVTDLLSVWESCRFVKMGWFSAREAITLVDRYVHNKNMIQLFN